MKKKVLVTGANGHLGKKFLLALSSYDVCALVRSEKAQNDLINFIKDCGIQNVKVAKCDYLDMPAIKELASTCKYVVHLVGIIKENKENTFDLVHRQTTEVLIEALKDSKVEKISYINILGSKENSRNTCFSTRGFAEKVFLKSDIPCLILQVPMVLGEGDYASTALRKHALSHFNFTFRKKSLEQPIYAGDIVEAIRNDILKVLSGKTSATGIKFLAGIEPLTRENLIQMAAKIMGVKVRVFSVPLALGICLAWVFEKLLIDPPISRAMLGVLDHDDNVDPFPACKQLDIELTSLKSMLKSTMAFKANNK